MWYIYNGDLNVAPDGYIYTEGANTITVPLNVKQTGDYCVLAQVYDGLPDSQGISFTIDDGVNYVFKPTFQLMARTNGWKSATQTLIRRVSSKFQVWVVQPQSQR